MRSTPKNIAALYRIERTFFWTAAENTPSGPFLHPPESCALTLADEALLTDPAALGAQLRAQCPALPNKAVYGLPLENMLLRIMPMPECAPEELDDIVRLQLEKYFPFPEDRLATAYEILPADSGQPTMLMAGIQKDAIEFAGTLCRHAGLELQRIDATAAAWWHLLRAQLAEAAAGAARLVLMAEEGSRLLAIVVQNNQPLVFTHTPFNAKQAGENFAAELAAELQGMLLTLDLEHGPASLAGINCWTEASQPPAWIAPLQTQLACPAKWSPLDSLPALSTAIAQRMFTPLFRPQLQPAGASTVIDFTPRDWHAAAAKRKLQRRLLALSAIVLAVWGLVVLGFFSAYHWVAQNTRKKEALLQNLKAPAEEVRLLQQKVRAFEQSLARDHLALETLREVSQLLPQGIKLTSFQFKRAKNIILRGEAETVEPIYDFKQALDGSPLFATAELGAIQPGKRREITVQTFQITLQFKEARP